MTASCPGANPIDNKELHDVTRETSCTAASNDDAEREEDESRLAPTTAELRAPYKLVATEEVTAGTDDDDMEDAALSNACETPKTALTEVSESSVDCAAAALKLETAVAKETLSVTPA